MTDFTTGVFSDVFIFGVGFGVTVLVLSGCMVLAVQKYYEPSAVRPRAKRRERRRARLEAGSATS